MTSALARCLGSTRLGGEGIGEIFAGAAEIKQEIDADIVADQRDDPDHRELLPSLLELERCETLFRGTDVYVPIGQWSNNALKVRSAGLGLHGIGRLKPGVTIAQAQADLNTIMGRLAETYPETNRNNGAKVSSLKERMLGGIGPTLWLLLGAVVGAADRLRECQQSVTRALDRPDPRICDSRRIGRRKVATAPAISNREFVARSCGRRIWTGCRELGYTCCARGVTNHVAARDRSRTGFARPDFHRHCFGTHWDCGWSCSGAEDVALAFVGNFERRRRGASNVRGRAQGVMVAVEIALALVLLVGAGLMIRSLRALWNVDPGFRSDNVLTFSLSLSPAMRTGRPAATRATLRELSDRIGSTPGIRAVSFSAGAIPLAGEDDLFFWIDGQPKPESQSQMNMAVVYRVEPGYLTAMGIPLKQGRFFSNQDDERSQSVVVIDEVFARKYFGDRIRSANEFARTARTRSRSLAWSDT